MIVRTLLAWFRGIASAVPLAALAAAALAASVAAGTTPTHSTKISYLAGASVYVDGGRAEGYLEGDTLAVTRGGATIARLRVTFLTTHRASCDTLAVSDDLRIGDTVWWVGRDANAPAPVAAAAVGGAAAGADSTIAASPIVPASGVAAREASPIHGRIGARLIAVQDHGSAAVGFTQPALDVRLDGANLRGAPVDVSVDARSRRTNTTLADGRLVTENVTKVYRATLSLHDRSAHYRLTVGRQTSPTLASVSMFDGALGEYASARWSGGLFSGSEPDPVGFRFSRAIIEHGGFVELHSRPLDATRWSAAVGGVTSTDSGQTNRDFAFMQATYQTARVSGMVAQEVDINRGWRHAAGDATISPTSTFMLVRVQATRPLAINVGYDSRRNVRLYSDHLTPETEFDDRFRAGGWVGASYAFGAHVRVDGDVRNRGGAAEDRSHAWSTGAELYRLLPWNAILRARYAQYSGTTVASRLTSLALGFDPLPVLHLECTGGRRQSSELLAGTDENVNWLSGDFDLMFGRHWFLNASVETDRSQFDRLTQEYLALSRRF